MILASFQQAIDSAKNEDDIHAIILIERVRTLFELLSNACLSADERHYVIEELLEIRNTFFFEFRGFVEMINVFIDKLKLGDLFEENRNKSPTDHFG